MQDKKQYEKQVTRNRIGHAFRNSWGRKDSKKRSSQVNDHSISFVIRYPQKFGCTFVFAAGYGNSICYLKLHFHF